MKKTFVNRKFQKLLIQKEASRVISNDKIKSIGIISTADISKLIDIKKEVKAIFNVDSIKLFEFNSSNKKNIDKLYQFSEKSFGWKAQVKDSNFTSFLNEPFDLLIGYFNTKNLYLELAVLKSKARFKAGISKVNQKLYDIEIAEDPMNTESFLSELKKYLEILQKL